MPDETRAPVTPEKLDAAKVKFAEYDAICEEERQLDDMMAALKIKKSGAVQAIESLIGKGPFKYKDQEILIMKRGETYFFRLKGQSSAIAI